MFTGIVEEIGTVCSLSKTSNGTRLTIDAKAVLKDARIGDSISVNGCCLTVVDIKNNSWSADVVNETLAVTCLKELVQGHPVNLEAAMRLNGRLGGHLMQGHVDGVGTIAAKTVNSDGSTTVTVSAPPSLLKYVIYKGSIAVDGVSLTIADVGESSFSFAMIPHTATVTNLGWKQIGASVNLEVDMIAKYVEKLTR